MLLKESERKAQLKEIVARHLTGLFQKYRFAETAKKSERLSRDLILLSYEELKSELFLKNFPIRSGEILSLFDEFFRGSFQDFYQEMIQLDLELYFLTLPDEPGSPGPAPQGRLEEIVEEETEAMRKIYRDLMRQPHEFLVLLEKTFSNLLGKLEAAALAPEADELLALFRGKFPDVEDVYFKVLGKFRDRMAALPEAAAKRPEPELPPPPRAEPRPPPQPEAGPPQPPPSPARPSEYPRPASLFRDLVESRKMPPQQYYSFIKDQIGKWEQSFGSEKDHFHRLIFSLYKASQKFRDRLEQLKEEMDEELINAGYLNAALSIAFAKSAEGGMRGQGVKISIGGNDAAS